MVTVVRVGVPVHRCSCCGSAEITYQNEFLSSAFQILCASLAYIDDILSVALLCFPFGYLMSGLVDHVSDVPCFHDDSIPVNGHPLALQQKYKKLKNKYIDFLSKIVKSK